MCGISGKGENKYAGTGVHPQLTSWESFIMEEKEIRRPTGAWGVLSNGYGKNHWVGANDGI